jgi:hypothetical protein
LPPRPTAGYAAFAIRFAYFAAENDVDEANAVTAKEMRGKILCYSQGAGILNPVLDSNCF